MKKIIFICSLFIGIITQAQETFPVNGIREKSKTITAFTNATLHTSYNQTVENGVLLIQDGNVIASGSGIKIPKNAVVVDAEGKHIYPSFVEVYSNYGIDPNKRKEGRSGEQFLSSTEGAFSWNEALKAEVNGVELFKPNEKSASEYIKLGFGSILSHQTDGIMRGTSVFSVLNTGQENEVVLKGNVSNHLSFSKGTSRQDYPSSLMGSIALIRQAYLDAEWYKTAQGKEFNLTLEAINAKRRLPQIFEVSDKLSLLRADKVGDEFGIQYIMKGSGDEYQRIEEIKQSGASIIASLNFPKAYDVEDPYAALLISLEDMKHWEQAPANLAELQNNDISFAISSYDLKDKKEFWANIRKAIAHGLSEENALKALTYTPASMIGMEKEVGNLNKGAIANFIITSDELFSAKNSIHENWVKGEKHHLKDFSTVDIRGTYNLNVDQKIRTLTVSGTPEKTKAEITYDLLVDSVNAEGDLVIDLTTKKPLKIKQTQTVKVALKNSENQVSLTYQLVDGLYSLAGVINTNSGSWDGNGNTPNGTMVKWTAIRKEKAKKDEVVAQEKDSVVVSPVAFPNMAYGFDSIPEAGTILIKGATVWTLEEQGTLVTDVLVKDGKISHIGNILDSADPNTIVVDGTGMHLTPGIVDEHSHIAISQGVNECTQANTAEVSIADVINSNDINIYRQLSGGVTTAHLLHGSCNPIGGQSGLIKLRWGQSPQNMAYENSPKFIKFALGENVKRAGWGDNFGARFPQTRMGVEQVYYDAFIRAKEYEAEWAAYKSASSKKKSTEVAPRKDLELETLVEIMNSERFVSCHSYQQGEINMLMHIADSMGFKINTFTHILEGYKVADKMKEHGVGGSTFADWWAYKYEVKDAIPHNATLMADVGIVTAINSDDAEMARRLNQEAAKAVKYGGASEEEALKMVTLNPAKLLHLDDRTGSIKIGKDADLVLWSDNPLSINAIAQKTIIDGVVYYDIERDAEMRTENAQERARLISKMLEAKLGGAATQNGVSKLKTVHSCRVVGHDAQ